MAPADDFDTLLEEFVERIDPMQMPMFEEVAVRGKREQAIIRSVATILNNLRDDDRTPEMIDALRALAERITVDECETARLAQRCILAAWLPKSNSVH